MPTRQNDPWPRTNGSLLHWTGPSPPAELNRDVPKPLSDLVMRACRERATDRPANMTRLIELLDEIRRACGSARSTGDTSEPPVDDAANLTRSP